MKLIKYLNFFWFIVLLALIFFSLKFAHISADAPFYLAVSRDISLGLVPYKDIFTIYTPLMMYINSILYLIFDSPPYIYFLIFQYLVIISSGVILFKIIERKGIKKDLIIFITLLFLIAVLSSDGNYINLEIYILLCTLASYLLLLNKNYFFSGLVLALSVFFKQYGILNFLPFLLILLFVEKEKLNYILIFCLGAFLPLVIFFFYFITIENIELVHLITQLTGGGYGQKGISAEKSILTVIIGAKVFLLLIGILVILAIKSRAKLNKIDFVLIAGICLNLIPVAIQSFPHYFILSFPYIFILYARLISEKDIKFLITSNSTLFIISGLLFLRTYNYRNLYDYQVETANKYLKEYPIGSKVFLFGEIRHLYFLNDYRNPALSEVGYSYSFIPDESFLSKYEVLSLAKSLE